MADEPEPEVIKATDLARLMAVVEAAVELYNALETQESDTGAPLLTKQSRRCWENLGDHLTAFGLKHL